MASYDTCARLAPFAMNSTNITPIITLFQVTRKTKKNELLIHLSLIFTHKFYHSFISVTLYHLSLASQATIGVTVPLIWTFFIGKGKILEKRGGLPQL